MSTLIQIVNEHRFYSRQVFMLAKSDLIKTYRGASLGWAWAVIKPMTTLMVFWFAFTVGLRSGKPINGYPYFLWLLAGFTPWFYMRDMITSGAACIRSYKHLVTKMKFPISIIPTFVNLSHFYVNIVITVIAIAIYWMFGFAPDKYYLQIPIYTVMMVAFFNVYSLYTGMLSSISKDFQNLIKSSSQAIFWLSGIIFNVDKIHNETVRMILKFNPISVIATGYRNSFVYKKWIWEDKWALIGYAVTFTFFFIGSLWAFKKLRKDIPDVL